MKQKIGILFLLILLLSTTLVLAGTTKITIRMDKENDALVRIKDAGVLIDTPPIQNFDIGLAILEYDTSRDQLDYLILVHKNTVVDHIYTIEGLATGSEIEADFRNGLPPVITDLKAGPAEAVEQVINEEIIEEELLNIEEENITEETANKEVSNFNLLESLSTGKVVFYNSENGITIVSWILFLAIFALLIYFSFGYLKNRNKTEVEKYKHELESIKKNIRKKIREIKILKSKGIKLKKMIELEEGFLEEKKGLSDVEKEIDKVDSARNK